MVPIQITLLHRCCHQEPPPKGCVQFPSTFSSFCTAVQRVEQRETENGWWRGQRQRTRLRTQHGMPLHACLIGRPSQPCLHYCDVCVLSASCTASRTRSLITLRSIVSIITLHVVCWSRHLLHLSPIITKQRAEETR